MAKKSFISITLNGFDELLKNIEDAGGSIQKAVDSGIRKGAQVQDTELRAQMRKSNVESGLINRMPPPEIEWKGDTCTAHIGYKMGDYNPKDASDGYKAAFINYGTPRISPREYIAAAKRKAKPQIKKSQEEVLNKVLARLKK